MPDDSPIEQGEPDVWRPLDQGELALQARTLGLADVLTRSR
ncbi:MAG: hypothetical protein ACYDAQ_04000 [Mycobacteriales bacterium]